MSFEYDLLLPQDLDAMAAALHCEGSIDGEEILAPPVHAPPVPAPPVVSPSWTDHEIALLESQYKQWLFEYKGNARETEIYWTVCAKEFKTRFGKQRTPGALRKQTSLLKLKGTQFLNSEPRPDMSKPRKRVKNWPLLIEQWIDNNVHPHIHLSNIYLLSVSNACYKHFQDTLKDTLEDTLKDTLEDILEDLRTRSIDAWHKKITRMRMHRKPLAPAP